MRNVTNILDELRILLHSAQPKLSLALHDPITDVLASVAIEVWKQEVYGDFLKEVSFITRLTSLTEEEKGQIAYAFSPTATGAYLEVEDIDSLITEIIDRIGELYGLTRKEGTKAFGYFRFFFSDTSSLPSSIPKGTRVSNNENKVYEVIEDVILTADKLQYSPEEGLYYIDVPIAAIEAGTGYYAAAREITYVDFDVPLGYNAAEIEDGSDEETNESFLNRILLAIRGGNTIATRNGFLQWLLAHSNVLDAKVVEERDVVFGVIIPSSFYVEKTDTLIGDGSKKRFPFELGPVVEVSATDPAVSSIDYNYSSFYRGTVMHTIYGVYDVAPTSGTTITFNYKIDGIVEALQNELDAGERPIATQVLVKRGDRYDFTGSIRIRLYPEKTLSEDTANERLSSFFDEYKLGQNLELSDIVSYIADWDEVDQIDISYLQSNTWAEFSPDPSVGTLNWEDERITVDDYSYLRKGDITWEIL